jgi:DNA repair exonuclease SbcCD ATPase subunit
MQRKLPAEKRWGSPFLQGKIIGIFNHAFGNGCWANDICHYDCADSRTEFKIFSSRKTIKNELKKLRFERMMAREQVLAAKVDQKTTELQKAKKEIELYSRTLEQQVAERTAELVKTNKQLRNEIEIRKEAEANKEMLILDLQKTLKEIKALRGLLPICSSCKKVRDDKGYWNQIESYIQERSDAEFSHSICPECAKKIYPDLDIPNH